MDEGAEGLEDLMIRRNWWQSGLAFATVLGLVAAATGLIYTRNDAGAAISADFETLIDCVSKAVRAKLNDPKRLTEFVKNLSGGPEEYEFSVKELLRSGAVVMPYFIDEIRSIVNA